MNPGPLQNRIDPFGRFHAVPERGTLFGNRGGCLHDDEQRIRPGRPFVNQRWIACLLEFKGRRRELMQPNRYTELFFLDEATAFAAGHRPCMECRRADAVRFMDAWSRAHLGPSGKVKTISHIDAIAHGERIDPRTGVQRTSRVRLSSLPEGVFVILDEAPEQPLLLWEGRLYPWSFGGYGTPRVLPADQPVTLLTPQSFAVTFAAGYQPGVHPSAR